MICKHEKRDGREMITHNDSFDDGSDGKYEIISLYICVIYGTGMEDGGRERAFV